MTYVPRAAHCAGSCVRTPLVLDDQIGGLQWVSVAVAYVMKITEIALGVWQAVHHADDGAPSKEEDQIQ